MPWSLPSEVDLLPSSVLAWLASTPADPVRAFPKMPKDAFNPYVFVSDVVDPVVCWRLTALLLPSPSLREVETEEFTVRGGGEPHQHPRDSRAARQLGENVPPAVVLK